MDSSVLVLGSAITAFFVWRFVRTHQLYRYSLKVLRGEIEDTLFEPSFSYEFVRRALFGNHRVLPRSLLVRAAVYIAVAVVLYPFKSYGPELYLTVLVLVMLYLPWCVGHWFLLRRASIRLH